MLMPNNSITARIEFSFQGKNYDYTCELDLDLLLCQHDARPSLHVILARQHGIDTYSYLYEVMLESEIEFSRPQGFATSYLVDGEFDLDALADNWQERKALTLLQPIASRELDISNIEQHPALRRALIAAYNLGKNA